MPQALKSLGLGRSRCRCGLFEAIVTAEDGLADHHRGHARHALLVGVLGCPMQQWKAAVLMPRP